MNRPSKYIAGSKPPLQTKASSFHLLLFEKRAHICSPHDDWSSAKGPGLSGDTYMLVILSISVVIVFVSLLVLS